MHAFGRDDGGVAAAAQRLLQAGVGRDRRDLRVGQPAGGIDHEAAGLQRVVADRHLDLVAEYRTHQRAGKLRAVDLLMLRHQRVACQRVVVFPAGERAHLADPCVHHLEAGGIALAPHHSLVEGGRELAALEHQRAVGVEDQLRVVERTEVALVDAEHHHHAVHPRPLRHGLRHRPRHHHRALVEPHVVGAHLHRRLHEREVRVVGQEGLWENDQLHALCGSPVDGFADLVERAVDRVEVGRNLDGRGADDSGSRHGGPRVALRASRCRG